MRILQAIVLSGLIACRSDKDSTTDTSAGPVDVLIDEDNDGYDTTEDCDDANSLVHPGAEETCDGADNDCDGDVDEGVTSTFYQDADSDGFGDETQETQACSEPSGYVGVGNDCDDRDAESYPGAPERCDGEDNDCDDEIDEDVLGTWYADADADGYGAADTEYDVCDPPPGYVSNNEDCDDTDETAYPGGKEVCDEADNDCNGEVDEGVTTTFYQDADNDSYGVLDVTTEACSRPNGFASRSGDCNDSDATISPNAVELCDGADNDCDGDTDEDNAADASTWYADTDTDGYGDLTSSWDACEPPSGYVSDSTDCDDSDGAIYPGAAEVCNDKDDDCDTLIDDDDPDTSGGSVWYLDYDGDGYSGSGYTITACDAPSGFTASSTDCDDSDDAVYPGAAEVCNGVDDDCDGDIDTEDDDGPAASDWYPDMDGDGFGDETASPVSDCEAPSGHTADDSDCDDGDSDIYPEADEACNGEDDDCDGVVDNEEDVLGSDDACAGLDCADIIDARPDATDGTYWIDPDGDGVLEVHCDMSTDGGGWTLVASFNNDDGTYRWTKYGYETDYLDNWTDDTSFGALGDRESEDFKSPAFWRVEATDLLALDSNNEWASYDDSLSGTLADTLAAYSSCQDTLLTGVSIDSSDSTVATYGQIAFYGSDPNYYDSCALSYYTDATDSSVITLAGTGCGSAGFGHLGYLSGSGHEDRDFKFCLGSSVSTSSSYSCGFWEGVNMVGWFDETYCDYAMLYVR